MDGNIHTEPGTHEEVERQDRLKAANELEAIAKKFSSMEPKGRFMSLVVTKLEEACLWYSKLLKEED